MNQSTPSFFGALDALAADDRSNGTTVTLTLLVAFGEQDLMGTTERAAIVLLRNISDDGAAWRQIFRGRQTLVAYPQHMHQSVDDLPATYGALAVNLLPRCSQKRNEYSFLGAQVAK